MDIEEVRLFALGLHERVTEDLFVENWLTFRAEGKWFLLMQLDAPQPRVAVKLPPERNAQLRAELAGVRPAFHMNKVHWSDLYLDELPRETVVSLVRESFQLVVSRLPKAFRSQYG
ncbi:MAG: MmcQ/YjbR family DNA-binding protein [Bacteroidaceae bacterium]|nr:MmcQ/YjbR family DNA-binding protein [Bacteroidaceae bacterium]